MGNSTNWTEAECERLVDLIKSGCSVARAAVIFKRSISSVQNRARKLGTPFPKLREVKKLRLDKIEAAERELQR